MGYNVKVYRAQIVGDFLEVKNVRRLNWFSSSHDLNLTEHVWEDPLTSVTSPTYDSPVVKSYVFGRIDFITTNIDTPINNMKARYEVCIAVYGGHTSYQTYFSRDKCFVLDL